MKEPDALRACLTSNFWRRTACSSICPSLFIWDMLQMGSLRQRPKYRGGRSPEMSTGAKFGPHSVPRMRVTPALRIRVYLASLLRG